MVYDSIPTPPDLPEGWTVRFIRPGEEASVLRVLQSAFPRWPKFEDVADPLEHLRWKMSAHPVAAKFHMVVDTPDGIIGARLEWAFETKIGEKVYLVREPIDRGVMPDKRLRYAMSWLRTFGQQLRDTNFDMYFGYEGGATGMAHLRKYRVPWARYFRTMDVLVCDPAGTREATNGAGWQICDVPAFDERVDTLWSRAQSQFLFGIVRSSAYLNWRYADRRAGDYTILVAEEENRWLGYIVLRTQRDRGYICDLLTLPDRAGVADSLLASAVDRFRGDGFRHVEAWSDVGSVYRWSLDRAGFRTLRRSVGLTFRPLRFPPQDAAFLEDPMAPILFSAGDTDLV